MITRAVAVVDVAARREQVAVLAVRRNVLDVPGQEREEIVREVDDAAGFVLRRRLGGAAVDLPWICRSTVSVRRRKSMSPSCRPAASPSRSPAKAQTATKARNSAGATARACATCSGVGIRILVPALGTLGGVIATVGS